MRERRYKPWSPAARAIFEALFAKRRQEREARDAEMRADYKTLRAQRVDRHEAYDILAKKYDVASATVESILYERNYHTRNNRISKSRAAEVREESDTTSTGPATTPT